MRLDRGRENKLIENISIRVYLCLRIARYEIVVKFLSNEKWFPRKNIPSITNLFFDKSENRSFIYLFIYFLKILPSSTRHEKASISYNSNSVPFRNRVELLA